MSDMEAYRKCTICKSLVPESQMVRVKVENKDVVAAIAYGMGIGDGSRAEPKETERWVCKDCVAKNNSRGRR